MLNYLDSQIVASLKENGPLPRKPVYDFVVRLIDVMASGVGLLVISPLLGLIALGIKWQDGGPVFFRQDRAGRGGRGFRILKFRTMIVHAEKVGDGLSMTRNDPRVTRFGKFLREFHLDELPQLVHVLTGEMSLVGPRPALLFQKDHYEAWEMPRLSVAPGITGLSQVSGGNELNWDERIVIDVYFVRNRNPGMYVWVFAQTFLQLFVKKGIYASDGKVKGWTRALPQ